MISIKDRSAIEKMEKAGQLLSSIFAELDQVLKPGISTAAIDAWIEKQIAQKGMVSQMKGYHSYKHVSCISLNEVVVHGIPRDQTIVQEGDLVKVDVCAAWNGYCADMARMFYIGQRMPAEIKKFVQVAQNALDKGIEKAVVGNRLSDISAAIQEEVEKHGYGIVRDFAGHGIGKKMHEEPEILNYGAPGRGPILQEGMAFAIEPMITLKNYQVYIDTDGWTVKTKDKSLAAHVEDTVVVTQRGPLVVTRS